MDFGFTCKLKSKGVAETEAKIGPKPYPVCNFRCRSYNYENLTCSFEKPYNPIVTNFSLTYIIPLFTSHQVSKKKKFK